MSAQPITRPATAVGARVTTVAGLLDDARAGLRRLTPPEARAAQLDGALLVDIRPSAQRAAEGLVPGTLVIERNVLEWRLDPVGDARLLQAPSYDDLVVLICSGGYASSLAAASLQAIGLHRATDVAGGFVAWREAGLPVAPGP